MSASSSAAHARALSIRLATLAQVGLAMRERYPILRDISASIRTRRTVEESELALKLEAEFRADPTLFEDIDFAALIARIDSDARAENVARITTVLSEEDLLALRTRWEQARSHSHVRLQPLSHTVAASITYGCSLHHIRLQPLSRWAQARAELAVLLPIYSNLTSDEEAGVAGA